MKPLTVDRFKGIGKMTWTSDGRGLAFIGTLATNIRKPYLMEYPSGAVRRITDDVQSYNDYGLGITSASRVLVAEVWQMHEEMWRVAGNGDAATAVRIRGGISSGSTGIAPLPDGRIAYSARSGDDFDIWRPPSATPKNPLTADTASQTQIAASADGRYIVFRSDQAGRSYFSHERSRWFERLHKLTSANRAMKTLDVALTVSGSLLPLLLME